MSGRVRCYWCGLTTVAWPSSGTHKYEWLWCLKCEAPRDQNGQAFDEENDD